MARKAGRAIADRRGLTITAEDETAAAHYQTAVEAEPSLFMGLVLQGYFYLLAANAALLAA